MAAGTVTIVNLNSPSQHRIQFTAGPGDVNNVTVSQAGNTVTITDTGAIINEAIDPGCTGNGTNTVSCTDPAFVSVGATLNDGDDRIELNTDISGNFVLGGPGNDTLIGSNSATGGSEGMLGQEGDDTIRGRAGFDSLSGNEGTDDLDGGAGHDNADGGEDADIVRGGEGHDDLGQSNDDAVDDVAGGPGDDSFQIVRLPFPPGPGNDRLDGGPGIDELMAEDFTFLFFGEANAPMSFSLDDAAPNDTFGDSTFTLVGIEDLSTSSQGGGSIGGEDTIRGTAGANIISTHDDDDELNALAGADVIDLGRGDDSAEARDGFRDRIGCGQGTDTIDADQLDVLADCENVSVTFVQPFATSPPRTRYVLPPAPPPTLAGCAPGRNLITLGGGNDVRSGTQAADLMFAGAGNDVIDALAGDDCLDLGAGDDRGEGGAGNDLVLGGLGDDTLSGSAGTDGLRGDAGDDRVTGGAGADAQFGGAGADRLLGGSGGDRLSGQSGRDAITGSGGRDRVNGGSGGDRISGGDSGDTISGDGGGDRISGGGSRDSLRGGSGADRISARDGARDRVNCGSGRDRVTADRIDRVAGNCEIVRRG